jgi:hypothetical protein
MLFQKFDFSNAASTASFQINPDVFQPTWEYYYNQYNTSVFRIIEKGLTRNYPFNCRSRPLSFLIRHALELCLKSNLSSHNRPIPLEHDLATLYTTFNNDTIIPDPFKEVAALVDFDRDGAAFRYYLNPAANQPYFDYSDKIELGVFFEIMNNLPKSPVFRVQQMAPVVDYRQRKRAWDLTLHMGECRQLAHIRTQYDETIEFMIEGVLVENWNVEELYLPLMFLLRHSLEIALKYNIAEVQRYAPELIKEKNFRAEHSLVTLYNVYRNFLNNLDQSIMDNDVREQLRNYEQAYAGFNSLIHDLDTNSRYFRFPVDKQGVGHRINLRTMNLIDILRLYYHLDPFITFTNDVLEDQGLLCRNDPY